MCVRNNKYIEIYSSSNKQVGDSVDIGASYAEINHAKVTMITSRIVFHGEYFIVMFNADTRRVIAGTRISIL